ncbi:hypothetical protein BJ170DRAFT_687643 [Xylariales sp. AK1849]|nr:hypothetical protein BJ170DRAFT_687643 [Xylariales sp. AK1849]
MSALPKGWEWDYDGSRWFYRYKPSGLTQYNFPKPGDEFPEYVSPSAEAIDLAPEERLASERQVRRHSTLDGTPNGTRSNEGRRRKEPLEDVVEMGATGYFDPASFTYLGPGSYNDISPVGEAKIEAKSKKQEVVDKPSQVSSVAITPSPGPLTTEPVFSMHTTDESVAAGNKKGAAAPLVELLRHAELPGEGNMASAASENWSPVGFMAELATSDTVKCAEELAPIELDASSHMSQFNTTDLNPDGPVELSTQTSRGEQRRPESQQTSTPMQAVEAHPLVSASFAFPPLRTDTASAPVQAMQTIPSYSQSSSSAKPAPASNMYQSWIPGNKMVDEEAGVTGRASAVLSGISVLQAQNNELGLIQQKRHSLPGSIPSGTVLRHPTILTPPSAAKTPKGSGDKGTSVDSPPRSPIPATLQPAQGPLRHQVPQTQRYQPVVGNTSGADARHDSTFGGSTELTGGRVEPVLTHVPSILKPARHRPSEASERPQQSNQSQSYQAHQMPNPNQRPVVHPFRLPHSTQQSPVNNTEYAAYDQTTGQIEFPQHAFGPGPAQVSINAHGSDSRPTVGRVNTLPGQLPSQGNPRPPLNGPGFLVFQEISPSGRPPLGSLPLIDAAGSQTAEDSSESHQQPDQHQSVTVEHQLAPCSPQPGIASNQHRTKRESLELRPDNAVPSDMLPVDHTSAPPRLSLHSVDQLMDEPLPMIAPQAVLKHPKAQCSNEKPTSQSLEAQTLPTSHHIQSASEWIMNVESVVTGAGPVPIVETNLRPVLVAVNQLSRPHALNSGLIESLPLATSSHPIASNTGDVIDTTQLTTAVVGEQEVTRPSSSTIPVDHIKPSATGPTLPSGRISFPSIQAQSYHPWHATSSPTSEAILPPSNLETSQQPLPHAMNHMSTYGSPQNSALNPESQTLVTHQSEMSSSASDTTSQQTQPATAHVAQGQHNYGMSYCQGNSTMAAHVDDPTPPSSTQPSNQWSVMGHHALEQNQVSGQVAHSVAQFPAISQSQVSSPAQSIASPHQPPSSISSQTHNSPHLSTISIHGSPVPTQQPMSSPKPPIGAAHRPSQAIATGGTGIFPTTSQQQQQQQPAPSGQSGLGSSTAVQQVPHPAPMTAAKPHQVRPNHSHAMPQMYSTSHLGHQSHDSNKPTTQILGAAQNITPQWQTTAQTQTSRPSQPLSSMQSPMIHQQPIQVHLHPHPHPHPPQTQIHGHPQQHSVSQLPQSAGFHGPNSATPQSTFVHQPPPTVRPQSHMAQSPVVVSHGAMQQPMYTQQPIMQGPQSIQPAAVQQPNILMVQTPAQSQNQNLTSAQAAAALASAGKDLKGWAKRMWKSPAVQQTTAVIGGALAAESMGGDGVAGAMLANKLYQNSQAQQTPGQPAGRPPAPSHSQTAPPQAPGLPGPRPTVQVVSHPTPGTQPLGVQTPGRPYAVQNPAMAGASVQFNQQQQQQQPRPPQYARPPVGRPPPAQAQWSGAVGPAGPAGPPGPPGPQGQMGPDQQSFYQNLNTTLTAGAGAPAGGSTVLYGQPAVQETHIVLDNSTSDSYFAPQNVTNTDLYNVNIDTNSSAQFAPAPVYTDYTSIYTDTSYVDNTVVDYSSTSAVEVEVDVNVNVDVNVQMDESFITGDTVSMYSVDAVTTGSTGEWDSTTVDYSGGDWGEEWC